MKIHDEILQAIHEKWDDEKWIEFQESRCRDSPTRHLWVHLAYILGVSKLSFLSCCAYHSECTSYGKLNEKKRKICWERVSRNHEWDINIKIIETIHLICHDFASNNHRIPRYIYTGENPNKARVERVINDL